MASLDDDDDDYGSFFDRTDFNFARGNERLKAQNRLELRTFQKESMRSDVVQGFIYIIVRKKLPEGKLFLRVENIASSNLIDREESTILTKEEVLNESLSNLQLKMQENARKASGKEIDQSDHQLVSVASKMSHKYMEQLNHKPESGPLSLLNSTAIQPASIENSMQQLPSNKETQKKLSLVGMSKNISSNYVNKFRTKRSVPLLVSEHEVFKIEKSLHRATVLICKFTVKLETFVIVSCDQVLTTDFAETANLAGQNMVQSQLLALESMNPHILAQPPHNQHFRSHRSIASEHQQPALQSELLDARASKGLEFIKINTKITAFYVTNPTHAEFSNQPVETRLEKYRTGENFCESSADLIVLERLNYVDFHQWRDKTEIVFSKFGGKAKVLSPQELGIVPKPGVSLSVAKVEVLDNPSKDPKPGTNFPTQKKRSASGLFSPSKIYDNLDGTSISPGSHNGKSGQASKLLANELDSPESATKSGHRGSASGFTKLQLSPSSSFAIHLQKPQKAESITVLTVSQFPSPVKNTEDTSNVDPIQKSTCWQKVKSCLSRAIDICSKPTPTHHPVELLLDKRVFSKFDSTLSFVLQFHSSLTSRYKILDIVIWKVRSVKECLPPRSQVYSMLEPTAENTKVVCCPETCAKKLYEIVFHETVPIVRYEPVPSKAPNSAKMLSNRPRTSRMERLTSKMDIVHQFSILNLTKAYSSIDSDYFSL